MSKDNTADRAALLRAATLVRPALADRAYVAALTNIRFSGGWATAYNDKMAIAVRCDAPLDGLLVPGTLLREGLGSFGGKEVLVQRAEGGVVLKSGRSKVTLPTMPADGFPFKWPDDAGGDVIEVEPDMVKAVERCLVSVNNDAAHPAQRGVTIDADDSGRAVFFSTDNNTVSRAQCKTKVRLPGDAPVILPTFFCEQLVALTKAFPDAPPAMMLGDGWLEVQFSDPKAKEPEARLFSRVPLDLTPMDFPRIMQRHCGDLGGLKKRLSVVPDELDAALGRALMVLGGEVVKKASLKIDDGTLRVRAASDLGDADDSMKVDADDAGPVTVRADLVARGLKLSSRIGLTPTVTILAGGEDCEFVHIVAHYQDPKH